VHEAKLSTCLRIEILNNFAVFNNLDSKCERALMELTCLNKSQAVRSSTWACRFHKSSHICYIELLYSICGRNGAIEME
jgi:hypothetical protein